MIEEMHDDIVENLFNGDVYRLAEDLINIGYTKIDYKNIDKIDLMIFAGRRFANISEDRVVLSKDELNDEIHFASRKGYDQASKETANNIIDLIKTFCPDKKFVETITHIIQERYGAEIKE